MSQEIIGSYAEISQARRDAQRTIWALIYELTDAIRAGEKDASCRIYERLDRLKPRVHSPYCGDFIETWILEGVRRNLVHSDAGVSIYTLAGSEHPQTVQTYLKGHDIPAELAVSLLKGALQPHA
jgi:hypothetical protein